jgi:hypothetical protein
MGAKFTSMGCDGINVFQGARANVTTQMNDNVVFFMIGMHCFVY